MLKPKSKLAGKLIKQTWFGNPAAQTKAGRESFVYEAFLPSTLKSRSFKPHTLILEDLESTANEIRRLNTDLTAVSKLINLSLPLLHTESIASSQIEGVNADFEQLMLAEYEPTVPEPRRSVLANVSAMLKAIEIGGKAGPVEVEDLLAIHDTLMEQDMYVKDEDKGRFRREPVWIGASSLSPQGAEYVGAPYEEVPALIDDLLNYINRDNGHPLVKAAVAHAQFESIHPFVDGNGRVGRCLIHLILRRSNLGAIYIPPISLLLSRSKQMYVDGLTNYRRDSVTEWLLYFATITRGAVHQASELIVRSEGLVSRWRSHPDLGTVRAGSALESIISNLVAQPVFDVNAMAKATKKQSLPVRNAIARLEEAGIAVPAFPQRKRNRIWQVPDVFALVNEIADEASALASQA